MSVCVFSGLLDSEVLSTQAACEEAMTVLEEVIMFTFQQSVYYLTKVSQSQKHQGQMEPGPDRKHTTHRRERRLPARKSP